MMNTLEQSQCGLIVVDVQGKLARLMHDSDAFLARCATLIRGCRILEIPVLYMEHCVDKLGPTVPELAQHLSDIPPIFKTSFGGCGEPNFVAAVEQSKRTQWLICGIETHVCVYQTAMGLKQRNFQVEVVTDCVSSRAPENIDLALDKLSHFGVMKTSLEMCLFELMQHAGHPAFRDIAKLLK